MGKEIIAPVCILDSLHSNPPSKNRIYFAVAHELPQCYYFAPILFSSKKNKLTPKIKAFMLKVIEKKVGKNILKEIKDELVFFKIISPEKAADDFSLYFSPKGLADPRFGRKISYYAYFPKMETMVISI